MPRPWHSGQRFAKGTCVAVGRAVKTPPDGHAERVVSLSKDVVELERLEWRRYQRAVGVELIDLRSRNDALGTRVTAERSTRDAPRPAGEHVGARAAGSDEVSREESIEPEAPRDG